MTIHVVVDKESHLSLDEVRGLIPKEARASCELSELHVRGCSRECAEALAKCALTTAHQVLREYQHAQCCIVLYCVHCQNVALDLAFVLHRQDGECYCLLNREHASKGESSFPTSKSETTYRVRTLIQDEILFQ